jgi:hypothetical protein
MLAILLFAGIASAHVVVYQKETTHSSYENELQAIVPKNDILSFGIV